MTDRPDLAGIFAAQTDERAAALAIRLGAGYFEFAADPVREAKLIMVKVVGKELHNMTMADFDQDAMDRYIELCERRRAREPVSHLLGARDFWNHTFIVTKDVLDPRPDTETLVAAALDVPFTRVLDLGTGSGCIVMSLLAARCAATGIGADLSEKALDVAAQNAVALDVFERVELVQSDWFDQIDGPFDLIVSNPPYIAVDEMAGLAPELTHEPRMALTDEADGLSCYRAITTNAGEYLTTGGWLMVEIGPTQADAVSAMFDAAGLREVAVRRDLDGRDRVIMGQKPL